jgi:hypothetical protein
MDLYKLLTIDGTEVTEHGRTLKIDEEIAANDIDLASGHRRRYYSKNKQKFSINWKYLPDVQNITIDGRGGRSYLSNLVNTRASVTVGVELIPGEGFTEYECFIESYSEKLIRRHLPTKCSYYDIELSLVEV